MAVRVRKHSEARSDARKLRAAPNGRRNERPTTAVARDHHNHFGFRPATNSVLDTKHVERVAASVGTIAGGGIRGENQKFVVPILPRGRQRPWPDPVVSAPHSPPDTRLAGDCFPSAVITLSFQIYFHARRTLFICTRVYVFGRRTKGRKPNSRIRVADIAISRPADN